MKRFLSILAFCVAAVFTLIGAVAILKTGQTAIGIALLVGAGLFLALGISLRKKKRRRPSKPRGNRGASRKTPKVKIASTGGRRSARPEKKEPKKPIEPKPEPKKTEPEEKKQPSPKNATEPKAPKAPPLPPLEPEPPEEEKDVATQVQELTESCKEGYVYESNSGIAKIKEASITAADETHFAIELVVEISFFQGKLADEDATKAETNRVIGAVNEKIKWLRARVEKLGGEAEITARYDFNE